MQVGLLGSIIATSDKGTAIPIGGPRVRTLLALLALNAGQIVPNSRLIDGIWEDNPPASVDNALHTLVKRLRVSTMAHHLIQTRPPGYLLAVDPDDVDVHRFSQLLVQGRGHLEQGAFGPASRCFDEALGLWRGQALAGVIDSAELRTLATTLNEQRLAVVELWADAYLGLGRGGETLRELATEVGAHPFRETLVVRLIRALLSMGRVVDARQAFQRTRRILQDELGVEPSRELREALDYTPAPPASPVPAPRVAAAVSQPAPPAEQIPETLDRPVMAVLPRRPTSFVGREEDLSGVARALRAAQLVTLIGSGGIGKTRLAIEVAHAYADVWSDGCVLVELASISRECEEDEARAAVADALRIALGIREHSTSVSDTEEALSRILAERRILLILDNCEHVVAAVARLSEWLLERLPLLRILTTSRQALNIAGENLFPLRTLAVPTAQSSLEDTAVAAAVRLFVDRAVAVRPDFRLNQDNRAEVTTIVQGLDGLPLAIELAAARLRGMSLHEITVRLTDRFRLLSQGTRTAAPRHRTLAAVVAWSWDLLSDAEAELARRLSVFAVGATIDAVQQVCGCEDVLDTLVSLVDKSLVELVSERYRMTDTVRAYAATQLDAAGERERLSGAHADWFIAFSDIAAPRLRGAEYAYWTQRWAEEYPNGEAALRWAVAAGDRDRAVLLYGNLIWYWMWRGLRVEALAWREQVLAILGDQPQSGLISAYLACRFTPALPTYQDPPLRRVDDPAGEFDRLVEAAMTESRPPHPVFVLILALRRWRRGNPQLLAECTSSTDPWLAGNALGVRGSAEYSAGAPLRAMVDLEAAVARRREIADPRGLSGALLGLASCRTRVEGPAAAASLIAEAVALLSPAAPEDAGLLRVVAHLHLLDGDVEGAAEYLQRARALGVVHPGMLRWQRLTEADSVRRGGHPAEAVAMYRELVDDSTQPNVSSDRLAISRMGDEASMRTSYALALIAIGEVPAANSQLSIALELARGSSHMLLPVVGVGYAMAALAAEDPERAAVIIGAVSGINARAGCRYVPADDRRAITEIRALLGDTRFEAARVAGMALTVEQLTAMLMANNAVPNHSV
ncbi:AfsR/SARP family transcriptional regulator [Nocardia heshunensis]